MDQTQEKNESVSKEADSEQKALYSWEAYSRPYLQHTKEYYKNLGSIILLLSIILAFLKHFPLIVLIISVYFFIYILDTVKPQKTTHKITKEGIFTLEKMYFWDQLSNFWFETKNDLVYLYIENHFGLPPRLFFLIENSQKEELTQLLSKHLKLFKPEPSQIELLSQKFLSKLDLEGYNKKSPLPTDKKI